MMLTNDAALAGRVRLLRVARRRAKRYYHSEVGGNFRLDALQAALLRVKLPHLDALDRGAAGGRRALPPAARRSSGRPERCRPRMPAACGTSSSSRVPGGARDRLAAHLADRHISTAIYYPVPLHLQACFRDLGSRPR